MDISSSSSATGQEAHGKKPSTIIIREIQIQTGIKRTPHPRAFNNKIGDKRDPHPRAFNNKQNRRQQGSTPARIQQQTK